MAAVLEMASAGNDALKLLLLEHCDYLFLHFPFFVPSVMFALFNIWIGVIKMSLCITSVNLQQEDLILWFEPRKSSVKKRKEIEERKELWQKQRIWNKYVVEIENRNQQIKNFRKILFQQLIRSVLQEGCSVGRNWPGCPWCAHPDVGKKNKKTKQITGCDMRFEGWTSDAAQDTGQ